MTELSTHTEATPAQQAKNDAVISLLRSQGFLLMLDGVIPRSAVFVNQTLHRQACEAFTSNSRSTSAWVQHQLQFECVTRPLVMRGEATFGMAEHKKFVEQSDRLWLEGQEELVAGRPSRAELRRQ